MKNIFVNFDDALNRWDLDTIIHICQKVKEYINSHGLEKVELHLVEDNTWSDIVNQRYDIEIRYMNRSDGHTYQQKLLMLRDKVYNCTEVHEKFGEFYPER